ncbi:MAG: transposase family protein, partial [Leptospiraceae bacterium]|nr:transposase family protein [Leptospiraceae bacterium]
YSINSYRLLNILNELKEERILPKSIIVDNGPEFTSKAFLDWALRNNIDIHFISKGKPTENGYIESFNGKLRNECLNEHWFNDIEESREILSEWIDHYNNERPHSSLKGLSPMEYLKNVA